MPHQDALWLTLLLFHFQAETSATQLNGILGESVTFQLNESKPFVTISWSRNEKNNGFRTLALVAPMSPCKIFIPHQEFKERIHSARDCRNLQFSNLKQEDSNRYTANIALKSSESINEHFDLKVYKRLQSADLSIDCIIRRGRTKSLQLNCSVEKWKDKLKVQWFVAEGVASGVIQGSLFSINYTSREIFEQEVSCKAENPVSKVSRTMLLKEACSKQKRFVNRKDTGFMIAGLSMLFGIIAVVMIWLMPCRTTHPQFPSTAPSRTAEGAQLDPENPLPPPPQPPG